MWDQKEWLLSTWEKCLNDSSESPGKQPQVLGGGTSSSWRSVILFRFPVIFLLLLPLHLCNYWPIKQFTSILSFDAHSSPVICYKQDRCCYFHFMDWKTEAQSCLITQLVRSQVRSQGRCFSTVWGWHKVRSVDHYFSDEFKFSALLLPPSKAISWFSVLSWNKLWKHLISAR